MPRYNQPRETWRYTNEFNDLPKKWQQYLAEQHQNDLDSSGNTDGNEASDTFVSGLAYLAVDTMTGLSESPATEPERILD